MSNSSFLSLFITEDCFQETVQAMVHLGINAERQSQLFRVKCIGLTLWV